jgi:hypothetical protein
MAQAVCRLLVAGTLVALPAPAVFAQASTSPPTFTKDVAPILQAKCESCHRPNSIAPMSLVTFEETRPWARSIRARVAARQMPPWHIDKTVGIQHFANDRSLSDRELETIVRWVNEGARKGDPAHMPPPVKWPDTATWNYAALFGEPDLVITSPAYTQKGDAQDAWYKPVVPTGLTEPRWVRAIEIRPATVKGRRITHHALARLQQEEPKEQATNDDDSESGPGLFMEWAVGKQGEIMRPNSGKLMLAGSKIIFDIHYHAVGEDITDSVELGIYFYPKGQEPKHRQVLGLFHAINGGSRGLDIPPHTVTTHQGVFVMKKAGRLENFQPHMHLRGKGMMMEAILPTGQTEVLSLVSDYQFNWHNNYVYADEAAPLLPKGTVLRFTSWHDNTKDNPDNPDPTQWVGWGDRTVDEMAHAWVNITYLTDQELKEEQEKRKSGVTTTTAQQR